jgi:hypothetical protein
LAGRGDLDPTWVPAAAHDATRLERSVLQRDLRADSIETIMARLRNHCFGGFVFSSLMAFACSAPPGAGDDEDSVPDYIGTVPGSGVQPPGTGGPSTGTPNTGAPNTGATPPSSEAVGNNGNVPIDGANSGNNSGANGTPTNPPPTGGTGGSAMTPPPAGGGVAGSSMQPSDPGQAGQGGSGNVPPGNNDPPPNNPPPNNPPPNNPPVGAGCGDGAIFCEDFDAIALGPITATVNGMRPDRTVSIVEEAGRGRVLQVLAGTGYGNKSGVYLDNFQPPNNSHFGRAFIRVQQFPTAGGDHWVIVEATLNENGERVRPVGGQFQRWAPGSAGPSGDWTDWTESDAVAAGGVWACVEWQINGANGANDVVLWVDGTEVLPLDHANFNLPAFNLLWLGWVVYQTGQPPTHEVRFDDVVISSERVGCN